MEQVVNDVLSLMARNRRRWPKAWVKMRVDRLHKLQPHVDRTALETAVLTDPRVKTKFVEGDDGMLYPAVQLRFEAYQQLRNGSGSLSIYVSD